MTAAHEVAESCPVLFVADEIATTGAGTEGQLLRLIEGLSTSRFEPHLGVLRRTDLVTSGSIPCPVHLLDIERIATPSVLPKLASLTGLVRHLNAGIVHTYFNDAAIVAPAFGRLAGARVVGSRRDMGFWYTPRILKALRAGNTFVDVIIANCNAVKENVHEREGFPRERIAVIGNGQVIDRFAAHPDETLRQRLGIAPTDPIVGMVANLNARKRHADLVRAVAQIRKSGRPAHVVLIGSGPEHAALEGLAATLGIADAVHVIAGVTEAIPFVKHFDVAVLCSESEGFSNAILEYAFCERPIVCSNVGGNPEFVRPDDTGLLVDVGDVPGLAAAITRLLANPADARALGGRAGQEARTRFSAGAMIDSHVALYDRVLVHPRGAAGAQRTS